MVKCPISKFGMRNKTFLKNFEDFVLKCNKARGIKMLNLHKNLNKLLFHKYINYNPYLLSVFKYAPNVYIFR